ncbi:hypothetical protein ACQKDS_19860 [Serratia sp. NPDC078593]|jgi:hypothetical protein|uniref:hypothetical protein n=1 Tax=unclassified Serratia (in: enterobacteria) TaxID=2647522 RepID=UPI0037D1CEA5
MAAPKKISINISGQRVSTNINTIGFFDSAYQEPTCSAIDIFNEQKLTHIKLLGVPQPTKEWALLANLVMLGFVSSVESYCRRIIRKILTIDDISKSKSYKCTVSYAAALHHEKNILPEALLEGASFISVSNIVDSIKKFTGLVLDVQQPQTLGSALKKYEQICQLRHCIVHRSGFFGVNNAIELGFHEHQSFLEKPILIGYDAIQAIASACDNVVKELNDILYSTLLHRSIGKISWTGDFRTDKKAFSNIFDIFYCSQHNENKNAERLKCYRAFCQHYALK